jgi:hypothetical protein
MTTACQTHPTFRLPGRYAPVLFALLMSISLSGLMAFVITAINTGFDTGFFARWLRSYALAWSMAFPLVTVAAPRVRRLVDRITN